MQHEPRCPGGLLGARDETHQGELRPHRHVHPGQQTNHYCYYSKEERELKQVLQHREAPYLFRRGKKNYVVSVDSTGLQLQQGFGGYVVRSRCGSSSIGSSLAADSHKIYGHSWKTTTAYTHCKWEEEKEDEENDDNTKRGRYEEEEEQDCVPAEEKSKQRDLLEEVEDADNHRWYFVFPERGLLKRLARGEKDARREKRAESIQKQSRTLSWALRRVQLELELSASGPALRYPIVRQRPRPQGPGELVEAPRTRAAEATTAQAVITPGSWPIGPGRLRAGLTPSGRGAPTGESGDQQLQEQQQQQQHQYQHQQPREKPPLHGDPCSLLSSENHRLFVKTRSEETRRSCGKPTSVEAGFLEDRSEAVPAISWLSGRVCVCREKFLSVCIRLETERVAGRGFRSKVRRNITTLHQSHRLHLRARSTLEISWKFRQNPRSYTRGPKQPKQHSRIENQSGETINNEHSVAGQRSKKAEEQEKSREGSGFRGSDAGLPAAWNTQTRVLAGGTSSVTLHTTPKTFTCRLCRLANRSRPSSHWHRCDRGFYPVVVPLRILQTLLGILDIGLVSPEITSLLRSCRDSGAAKQRSRAKGDQTKRENKRKKSAWSTVVPKERRQARGDASVPIKEEPMRLEQARLAGPPFATKLSERKKARGGRRSFVRPFYCWERRLRPEVNLSSLAPPNDQPKQQPKRLESNGDCPMSPAFLCKQDYSKRCSVCLLTGARSSSVGSTALLKSSADGSEDVEDDQQIFVGNLEKSGKLRFQDVCAGYLENDVASSATELQTLFDLGIDYYQPKSADLDVDDPKFSAGLVRSTAFRDKSHEYHYAARVMWSKSMEDPQDRPASTEKKEEETEHGITMGLSAPQSEIRRATEKIDVEGLHIAKRKTMVLENGLEKRSSLENNIRVQDSRAATSDAASVYALNVIHSSSHKRHLPYDMLDNTAFNDDDDNEHEYHNGDNDDDYIYCSQNDDDNNYNYCMHNGYRDLRRNVDGPEDDNHDRSMVINACFPERTKKGSLSSDNENDSIVFETSACMDVPGGKLFTVLRPNRSYTSCRRTTCTEGENNLVFFTKKREPVVVNEMSTNSNCRIAGRTTPDREKWKKPRRRCRRKYGKKAKKDVDGHSDCSADDDHSPLEKESGDKYCKGIGERNDYTARSPEPITRVEGKRSGRRKWYNPFSEHLAETKEEVLAKGGGDVAGEKRPTRQVGGKHKETGSERRRGSSSYGLLFALYLLALPILCSTDPSGPVALALAQKSPLTYGDNFTVRNSSVQHQGHHAGRDGVLGHDSSHPYNEYTWEVNQINPWLSACDLAGPAPADLQGSCGPPEVPKNCPLPCATVSQGDINKPFFEVIERLGVHTRAKTGAGGSRWRPAGTTTTNKRNKDKDESGNMRSEEAVKAPEQCLFYLEESHKRDICRDNFGRGSSLSFSNSRENRYWFVSGLRLRHCCEHAVVNALAPGNGGPLEDVLNGGRKCAEALDKLLLVDALAARLHCEFEEVLARYDCAQPYSVIHNCTHCKEAYRKWVCSSLVPYFAHGGPPAMETSAHAWSGLRLRPCRSFCQSVEQRCPYLLPGDRAPAYPTQYAGEPTFLCRDPNIPETGEQALRALHGNDEEECCFHVCSEVEPGSGVCANCKDSGSHKRRAGYDTPTAPHCELAPSSVQSGSTGHQSNAEVSGSSNAESTSSNPLPLSATSASFCGGGGVGSMSSSSSGQSTTQPPPPSSISLIYLIWVWAALISLCTGQTVFPWAPPSSLLMVDYSSARVVASSQRSVDEPRIRKKFYSNDVSKMAAASWWSCSSSSSSSLSSSSSSAWSSSLSWPRFHESVLKLARVFLVSLFKTIHDYLRRFVNFFLVLLDSLLGRCVRWRWGNRWWRLAWRDTIYSRWIIRSSNALGGWYSRSRSKERGWTEGPDCCIIGKWYGSGKNEPRPPRGRRRMRRRRRRRRRSRRRCRRCYIVELPLRTLFRPLGKPTTATEYAGISRQPLLATNHRFYYGDAGTWLSILTSWSYSFYRSQRHSYSYCKWKGPS